MNIEGATITGRKFHLTEHSLTWLRTDEVGPITIPVRNGKATDLLIALTRETEPENLRQYFQV